MPTTPISASVLYNSTTPTTIYTVPATKTAVVKGVLASSLVSSIDTVTVNKVSGGVTYPLTQGQESGYITQTSTYYLVNGVKTINLLQAPVTLAAGDSISISSSSSSFYKTPNAVNNSDYKISNIAYLNGNYIAVGQEISTGLGLILTSTDGNTFTKQTFTGLFGLTNVTYGNGYYVVCNSTGGAIHHSTNLTSWTQVSLPSTYPCYAIAYGGGKFVTGGGSGRSYYATTTPLSWTASTVFNSNTINSIAYIGTNYFYGNSGVSYYTADFSTYTQPYSSMAAGTSVAISGYIAATNNKVLTTESRAPNSYPNAFLRTSSNGSSWSSQTTTTNNLSSYSGVVHYAANGGYFITRYYSSSTPYYLYSADGVSWTESNYSFITGSSNNGLVAMSAAYQNTADATYGSKVFIYQGSSGNFYIQGCDIASAGYLFNYNAGFSASNIVSGNFNISNIPVFVANPYDGSWRAVCYYGSGGNYSGPFYYGYDWSNFSDGQNNSGYYNSGQGFGYMVSAGIVPNSPKFLGGTENGWVFMSDSYNSGWYFYIGPNGYVTNPTGITWGDQSGSAVAGFARSGDSSTSTLVILWANGTFATSSNQGSTWTQGNVGASGFGRMSVQYGACSITYGNGNFYAMNNSGTVFVSSNGISWSTMPSSVESIYSLNSQNVFLTTSGLFTSASGVVNSFTPKTNPTSSSSNPATNRMAYVGSTYYLTNVSNTLYSSSDLTTWTSKGFSTQQINDVTYFGTPAIGLAYSGTGTSIVASSANAATPSTGKVGKLFTPSSSIVIGNATASIVQID